MEDVFFKNVKRFEHCFLDKHDAVIHLSRKILTEILKIHNCLGLHQCIGHSPRACINLVYDGNRVIKHARCCGHEFISEKESHGCIFYDGSQEMDTSYPDNLFVPMDLVKQPFLICENSDEFATTVIACALATHRGELEEEVLNEYVSNYVALSECSKHSAAKIRNISKTFKDASCVKHILERPGFKHALCTYSMNQPSFKISRIRNK